MQYEDWRANPQAPYRTDGPPPSPPAGPGPYSNGRPPKKSRSLNWPTAILLLGLALIGGCCFSFAYLVDSAGGPMDRKSSKASVGVLMVEGEITGSIWATEALHKFKNDEQIKSVVIRINSPGGAVAPCQEIYQAVRALKKPVVVSMGSVAASGGLYIAAAGDLIMSNPGTITGSIGVIMQSVEVSGTMQLIGLKSQTIKSGEFKDLGSPFREMKPNERALLEAMVLDVYEQFLADLGAGRPGLAAAELRRLADGRIYNGSEARKLGLVDELGGFEEALLKAAKMGGLPADKRPEIVIEDGRKSWWNMVLESAFKGGGPLGLGLPPAFTPGFSLKYIYQPELGS